MVTQTPTTRASLADLAEGAALLARGVDVVIWLFEGGYARLTREDLPAIEAFLEDRTDTLSLSAGLLPDAAVNA